MESETIPYGKLFRRGARTTLAKGEVFRRSDEPCKAMGLVLRGELRLSRLLSTGHELHIRAFRTGDLFAELIVFTGETYPGWLIASEPTEIVEAKLPHVLEYLSDKEALVSFFGGIAGKMAHLSSMMEVQSLKTVKQKIAFALLYRKNGIDRIETGSQDRFRVNVSRLAELLDCSREAVSRALTRMESDGLVSRSRGVLTIKNQRMLDDLLS